MKNVSQVEILRRFQTADPLETLQSVVTVEQVLALHEAVRHIHVAHSLFEYIGDIAEVTRSSRVFRYGASPRGTLGLMRAAQALALLRERSFVLPDDIRSLAPAVLSHRLILSEEEQLRGSEVGPVLEDVLESVPLPPPAQERTPGPMTDTRAQIARFAPIPTVFIDPVPRFFLCVLLLLAFQSGRGRNICSQGLSCSWRPTLSRTHPGVRHGEGSPFWRSTSAACWEASA